MGWAYAYVPFLSRLRFFLPITALQMWIASLIRRVKFQLQLGRENVGTDSSFLYGDSNESFAGFIDFEALSDDPLPLNDNVRLVEGCRVHLMSQVRTWVSLYERLLYNAYSYNYVTFSAL